MLVAAFFLAGALSVLIESNRAFENALTAGKLSTKDQGGGRSSGDRYFSAVLIPAYDVLSVVPRPFTAAMMASEIPAAIRAYSIAVAPD
jgi:hypothetical protein